VHLSLVCTPGLDEPLVKTTLSQEKKKRIRKKEKEKEKGKRKKENLKERIK